MKCPKCGHTITPKEAAQSLGSLKSDSKAIAARENGKLGGRPKKPWYTKTADSHFTADIACAREWACACGPCRTARLNKYRPKLVKSAKVRLKRILAP